MINLLIRSFSAEFESQFPDFFAMHFIRILGSLANLQQIFLLTMPLSGEVHLHLLQAPGFILDILLDSLIFSLFVETSLIPTGRVTVARQLLLVEK